MDPFYLLRGLAIGFAIAAPVGPIGVLVIRRSLLEGRAAGFASGLGAATADAFYGSLAAFGLTTISGLLVGQSVWVRLIGGAFLCYLGLTIVVASPAQQAANARHGIIGAYGSTAFLTLTNPTTILSFAAVFAALGLGAGHIAYATAALMVLGVFLGSSLWWLLLSTVVYLVRNRFSAGGLQWVNRISGATIAAFGLASLASVWGSLRRSVVP